MRVDDYFACKTLVRRRLAQHSRRDRLQNGCLNDVAPYFEVTEVGQRAA